MGKLSERNETEEVSVFEIVVTAERPKIFSKNIKYGNSRDQDAMRHCELPNVSIDMWSARAGDLSGWAT
jgi:hypothetical protein